MAEVERVRSVLWNGEVYWRLRGIDGVLRNFWNL